MKNIDLIRKKEADKYFVRNKDSLSVKDEKIFNNEENMSKML